MCRVMTVSLVELSSKFLGVVGRLGLLHVRLHHLILRRLILTVHLHSGPEEVNRIPPKNYSENFVYKPSTLRLVRTK